MSSAFPTFDSPETIDAICLDMDGVLADLYNYDGWEELITSNRTDPYNSAAPLVDMSYLNGLVVDFWENFGIPTYVVSWSTMRSELNDWFFDVQVAKCKRYWLNRHLPAISDDNIFVVPYGTDKSSLVADLCSNPVLFDDNQQNCHNWWWSNAVRIEPAQSGEIVLGTLEDLYAFLSRWH